MGEKMVLDLFCRCIEALLVPQSQRSRSLTPYCIYNHGLKEHDSTSFLPDGNETVVPELMEGP